MKPQEKLLKMPVLEVLPTKEEIDRLKKRISELENKNKQLEKDLQGCRDDCQI